MRSDMRTREPYSRHASHTHTFIHSETGHTPITYIALTSASSNVASERESHTHTSLHAILNSRTTNEEGRGERAILTQTSHTMWDIYIPMICLFWSSFRVFST